MLYWTCWSSAFDSCLWEIVLCDDVLRTSRSTWQQSAVFVHLAVELLRVICLGLSYPQRCIRFPGNSVHRFVFPKMSCNPHCEFALRTTCGLAFFSLVKLFFSSHAYRFLNELCRQCVIEDDRMRSCLVKLQLSFLSACSSAESSWY